MPTEVHDVNKFLSLAEQAEHCRVKRLKEVVKLKLRTRGKLYTLKVSPEQAEELLKSLKCELREV